MIPPLTALFGFPVVGLILFRTLKPRTALVWTLLLGYLFLPHGMGWNPPLLPTIDKDTMPSLVALVCLLALARRLAADPANAPLPGWLPRHPLARLLIAAIVLGAFLTVITNRDPLVYGPLRLPGLKLYDGFSAVLTASMMLLPMLLARKYLASDDSQKLVVRAFCIAGLIYTLPIIFELVMSPQLHRMVYGYFPSSWKQVLRGGGYRPLVFLKHGLWLAIFMCACILAAAGYSRIDGKRRVQFLAATAWLLLILVACKSLTALIIVLLLLPFALLASLRIQLLVAAAVSAAILLYPALRGADLIPVDRAVAIADAIDPIRAGSLKYRIFNEDQLLAKANERPLFGWGGYSRQRIYDDRGNDQSTTDGLWTIVVGERGWVGYLGRFGLLCLPIMLLALRRRDAGLTSATPVLALMLAGNLIDLIPNAGLTPLTWIIAGSLIGRLEYRTADAPATEAEVPAASRTPSSTRFAAGHARRRSGKAAAGVRYSRFSPATPEDTDAV